MTKVTGIIEKIWENQTKAGTTYAYVVDNQRYGSYKTKLKAREGDNVSFEAEQNGNFWNIDTKTFRVLEAKPSTSTAGAGTSTAYVGKRDGAVQDAINYQSARKDALQLLDILASNNVVDFGTEKASGPKKWAAALAYVDKLTQRFFEDTKNLGHKEEEALEAPVKEKPVAKAAPAPVVDEFEDDDIPF